MDTQLQLLQVEERLMQESRRLAIEQAQLATVRALEAELARLRAYYSHNQAGSGAPAPSAAVRPAMPNLFPTPNTMIPGASFAQPQVFQPGPGQVPMTQGHQELPPGLVLPEGWTLAPLNRVEGTGGGMPQTEPPVPTPTVVVPQSDAAVQQEGTEQTMASSAETVGAIQSAEQNDHSQEPVPEVDGSVHHGGFPDLASQQASSSSLAQAEHPATSSIDRQTDAAEGTPVGVPQESPADVSVEAPAQTTAETQAQSSSVLPTTQPNGWGESSSWNFDNVDEGESSTQQTNSEEQPASVDKGKGRAVTVEDVEDAEQ